MKYIADIKEGDRVKEIYLCRSKQTLVSKTGRSYDSLVLQDKTGSVDGKIWDLSSGGIDDFDKLDYIEVTADVTSFQGSLQLNIRRVRRAEENECDPSEYRPSTERDIEEMYLELTNFRKSIQNEYLKKLLSMYFLESEFLKKKFCFHSAAKSVHHGYVGGLLEHTLAVTKNCEYMSGMYPILNRDLLLTAAMLHDIGKIAELSEFPENDYTDDGQLLGHIVIGCEWISATIKNLCHKGSETMTNETTLNDYEKIISNQTDIIKSYEKLIKSLPPVSPTVLTNGLIVETQALMKQPEQKPKDERERRQLFGARMKMIRQMLGLKQADIAKKLNITIQSVKNYESGIREPSIKNLIALAHILNVTTDWLLDVPPPLIEAKPFTA